jgi:glutaconyl-CoA/methylmalonyl-CoA decarboxylase subunit gamma
MRLKVKVNNQVFEVEIKDLAARPVIAVVEGQVYEVWPEQETRPAHLAAPAPLAPAPDLSPSPGVAPQPAAPLQPSTSASVDKTRIVTAPIPGVIVTIAVKAGDSVVSGKELCVLEAMKMKNSIRANRAGKIAVVRVSVGEQVKSNQVLVEYEG